ncbi:ABC transporter permease [Streptococcus bovimastitidis]|uniref:ABC transporter permease n=1 Tax=Streptococcus bovimastitidis TaxID=1856638 RepID=A0A1L8MNN6_9STRE|nr:ABC transporter permease [Streptococcus bovimastitidis]OJF72363.1 ABC transporter permease [Streptococcus bovimastitidis]
MFGKLLKYEFKSIGKWYFALNAGIIAIAAILSFVIKQFSTQETDFNLLTSLIPMALVLIFGALIAGSLLATLLIIINRFNKNIYGREGYLTMTLPVSEHSLLMSKLVSSLIFSFFNMFILALAFTILILPQFNSADIAQAFQEIAKEIPKNLSITAYLIVSFILSSISYVLVIYFSISVGQLFSNHRGIMAFLTYFAIQIILTIIIFFVNNNLLGLVVDDNFTKISNKYFLITSIEGLIQVIFYYFGTHFIMKYKLNLQ